MTRSGFTMIELVAALAVGGLALAAASALSYTAIEAAERQHVRILNHAGEMMGHGWLTEALENATAGEPGDQPYHGTGTSMVFSTRLPSARGWLEPVVVSLAQERTSLVLRWPGHAEVIKKDVNTLAFDFLSSYGADSPWLTGWQSSSAVPLAVRLRLGTGGGIDTLVIRSLRSMR